MNIVLLINNFLPKIGGRELVVYYMARSLQEMGHNVRVVGPSGLIKNRKIKLPFPVHRYPVFFRSKTSEPGQRSWLQEKELMSHLFFDIKVWGCDVLHAHITYPWGYLAMNIKRHFKSKLVITPHGIDIHTIPELGHGLRLDPELDKKIRTALNFADATTSISESIKSSLLDADAPEKKLHDIPNGVDLARFRQKSDINIMEWLGIASDSKIIVTVGNYHPRKGQAVIIEAMAKIVNSDTRAHLVIIGKGTDALRPLITKLNLENNVTLTGTIEFPGLSGNSKSDYLAAIYNNSKMYISAGINEGSEGLSLAILESMAAGLPIIGSDISGNRDIIFEKKNGYLVKPADISQLVDRVLKLLNDPDRDKMSKASLEIVKKYDWINITKMYLNLYEKLLP